MAYLMKTLLLTLLKVSVYIQASMRFSVERMSLLLFVLTKNNNRYYAMSQTM